MTNAPRPSPAGGPSGGPADFLRRFTGLAPEAMRDRVRGMTGTDLEHLIDGMHRHRDVPESLRGVEAHAAIDERLETLGARTETRERWRRIRADLEQRGAAVEQRADDLFMDRLLSRGGTGAALAGGLGITLLSWLGFRSARSLVTGTRDRGLLRGTIESVRQHPILSLFLAAGGISAGTMAHDYFTDNESAVVEHIQHEAASSGQAAEEVARTWGDRARQFVSHAGVTTVDAFVTGVATLFGGTVDPVTGQINLPLASLRPPVFIAYQAGVRRRSEGRVYSLFGLESSLNAVINDADRGFHQGNQHRLDADRARRVRALIQEGQINSPEATRLLDDLNARGVINMDRTRIAADTSAASRELRRAEAELSTQYLEETRRFQERRAALDTTLAEANERVRTGNLPPGTTAEQYILEQRGRVRKQSELLYQEMAQAKSQKAQAFAEAVTHQAEHGMRNNSGFMEGVVRKAERVGVRVYETRPGKLVVRSVMAYSMFPLFGETLSLGAHWLGGAKNRVNTLARRQQQGETLSTEEATTLQAMEALYARKRAGQALTPAEDQALAQWEQAYIVEESRRVNRLATKRSQQQQLTPQETQDLATMDALYAKLQSGTALTADEMAEMQRLEGQYVVDEMSERAWTTGKDWLQVGGGFVPVVGELIDFNAAFTGKDLNGRDLSTEARVTNGVMGTLGAASIGLGFFTGGLSIVAFRGIRTAIAGRRAWQVARATQTVARTARTADQINTTAQAGRSAANAVDAFAATNRAATGVQFAQRAVRTGQRAMQVYVYGHLGIQLTSTVSEWVVNGAETLEAGRQRAFAGINAAERMITGGPRPRGPVQEVQTETGGTPA